jgi:hypothetical protein
MRPELHKDQTVWITDGIDKGKRGKVEYTGFGSVSVVLDGESKVYTKSSVTTKDPNSIPLPPNFIPNTFKVGDKVVVNSESSPQFTGIEGYVKTVPNSVATGGMGRTYTIRVTKANGKSGHDVGEHVYILPQSLSLVPKAERIEGEEIAREDVRVGDTIRTTITSEGNGYTQTSSKEGKVTKIVTNPSKTNFIFYATNTNTLNYGANDEVITLVKRGEDPYVQILKDLSNGTVVSLEKGEGGEVMTYIKSVPWGSTSQWHLTSSASGRSSTFVTEEEVVDILSRGVAEIVHKVRKPVISVPAPPVW